MIGRGPRHATHAAAEVASPKPRRPLFRKYFTALFVAVVVALLATGLSDAGFAYRDQRATLDARLRAEARSAGWRIESFLEGIRDQLGWAVQLSWGDGNDERHRIDALRVLRQAPAIASLTLVDGQGSERLYTSRVGLNRVGSGIERSTDPGVIGARASRIWYGPVTFYRGSEPVMTMAMAGNRASAGVVLAEINLKLIWDVISGIHVGKTGKAFVLDQPGRLIAHPDISLVLRGADAMSAPELKRIQATVSAAGQAVVTLDPERRSVIAAVAPVSGVNWMVIAAQPAAEAFAPIYAALWRTGGLLLAGAAFAGLLAYWLARRMAGPIRKLEDGVVRIGAGQFDHKIHIATGDELELLAEQVNEMAGELALSLERSERINRLKRFLAPQVAELVDKAGDDSLLDGQRTEVVTVFCDLRGFTAFSSHAEPEEIMGVLGEYYQALGGIITRYEATLTSFAGDGLMVLVNAPVPCPDPALRAVRMAVDMQDAIQGLILRWREKGHRIGFGIGLAMGPAIVGRIGYESRVDYTAIGNVVNLASRLCSTAADGQILLDPAATNAVNTSEVATVALGTLALKGYDEQVPVFAVAMQVAPDVANAAAE